MGAGPGVLSGISFDIRDSLRSVRASGGASAIIAGTAAVAIGAGTLVFSVYEGVVLRPFPYPQSEELVNVYMTNPTMLSLADPVSRLNGQRFPLSYPAFEAWRSSEVLPFVAMGGYQGGGQRELNGDREVAPVVVSRVTAGVFEVLGVAARHGRVLTADEDRVGGPRVAILTDAAWRGRFGGDPSVLGETIRLGQETVEVIGIMPPGFYFPTADVEAYVPFTDAQRQSSATSFFMHGIARLRPGVDVEVARMTVNTIAERTRTMIARNEAGANVILRRELVLGDTDRALAVLFGTAVIMLLVAAVNITSLLLARSERCSSDLALRTALGARTGRIVRLQLVETLMLTGVGGLLGFILARVGLQPALALLPEALPRQENIGFNGAVAVFTIVAVVGTAVFAMVLPTLSAVRRPPRDLLGGSNRRAVAGRGTGRTRAALVVAEVAGAVVLLVSAALLTLSYIRLTAVDLGFDPENVAAVSVIVPARLEDASAAAAWHGSVMEQLRAEPSVLDAALTGDVPFSAASAFGGIEYERADGELVDADVAFGEVAAGHFEVLGIEILEGRGFETDEFGDPAHGVLVNETLASQLWPGHSPIGRRIREEGEWHEVVGWVSDVRTVGPADVAGPRLYVPRSPTDRFGHFVIRTASPVENLLPRLESIIGSSYPGVQLAGSILLERELAQTVAHPRFRTTLLIALSSVAALLALIGIYGLVGYTVARQRREIGVRMALGARAEEVLRAVVGRSVLLSAAGGATGIVLALPMGRVLRQFLFEVSPADPRALAGVLAAVLVVAAGAAWLPARRAASINPAESLRAD